MLQLGKDLEKKRATLTNLSYPFCSEIHIYKKTKIVFNF